MHVINDWTSLKSKSEQLANDTQIQHYYLFLICLFLSFDPLRHYEFHFYVSFLFLFYYLPEFCEILLISKALLLHSYTRTYLRNHRSCQRFRSSQLLSKNRWRLPLWRQISRSSYENPGAERMPLGRHSTLKWIFIIFTDLWYVDEASSRSIILVFRRNSARNSAGNNVQRCRQKPCHFYSKWKHNI